MPKHQHLPNYGELPSVNIARTLHRFRDLAFIVASVSLVGASPPVSGPPVELNATVPLSGGGAFLGASYLKTFQAAENVVNGSGGIKGRPLKIVISDTQTNPQIALQLTSGFIAKKTPLFIDGAPTAICNASIPIVQKSGPVDYCLSPLIRPDPGSYVFSANTSGIQLTNVAVRYFRLRGWKRIALLSSTDATGAEFEARTIDTVSLPENKTVELVAKERFAPSDISVAAQITRIRAAKPDAIFVWTAGTPTAVALRGINEANLNVPVGIGAANLIYAQLESYETFLPKQLFISTVLPLTPNEMPKGPIHDKQVQFAKALAAVGARSDGATGLPWDPIMILVDALRAVGPDATADQIRSHILHLHGWVGINGVYDFSDGSQRGIGENAGEMVQWISAKHGWVRASRPRGFLL
jgi:branched-chain amino acid transport system substrate-binding protein